MSTSTSIKEFIFNLRNNTFTIEFTKAGMDFSTVTKLEFELNGTVFDSTADPTFFDITTGPFPLGSGTFIFKLGSAGYVPADSGNATITLFDPSTPLGLQFAGENAPTKVEISVEEN